MTHPINEESYRNPFGFRLPFARECGPTVGLEQPSPIASICEELVCREVALRPPHSGFRVWSVSWRAQYWILAVWQWPTPDAVAAASLARHQRNDISLGQDEWLHPPAQGTHADLQTLYEMAAIAAEFDRRWQKVRPRTFFAYALDGPYSRDWTVESRPIKENRGLVVTGDIVPKWNTMEDAWDAGIEAAKLNIITTTRWVTDPPACSVSG